MDRRSFLALIASAPIAALAPLPKVLEQQTFKTGTAVAAAMRDIDTGISMRYITHFDGIIQTFNPEHWSEDRLRAGGTGYIFDRD